MKAGDLVRKIHVYDGTKNGGKPVGEILTVMKVEDHKPIDGPVEKDAIIRLSDGTFEHPWNLHKVDSKKVTPEEFAQAMRELSNNYDIEESHYFADNLIVVVLEENGFEEGAEIFKNMAKWYS